MTLYHFCLCYKKKNKIHLDIVVIIVNTHVLVLCVNVCVQCVILYGIPTGFLFTINMEHLLDNYFKRLHKTVKRFEGRINGR